MKSHTVKSNAKRLARGIAAAAPEKWEVVEPVPAPDGNWFPALRAKAAGHGGHDMAVIVNADEFPANRPVPAWVEAMEALPAEPAAADAVERLEQPIARIDADDEPADIPRFLRRKPITVGADFVAVADAASPRENDPMKFITDTSVLTEGFKQPEGHFIVTGRGDSSGVKRVPDAVAAVAAEKAAKVKTAKDAKALPARVTSTPEDIAARLAARRQRIAEAKANPAAAPAKPAKETMGDVIVKLCSRPEGATSEQLQEATKWQAHTLRGYIAGTLRKRGHDIKLTRGKPSVYRIEPAAA